MGKSVTKILIATYVPTLNKGELELLAGILKTFNVLGETEVDIFSFYPELDVKRYPSSIRLINIRKDLHLDRFLRNGSYSSLLLGSLFAGIQHLFFVFSYAFFGENVLDFMKSSIWREYCSSDALVVCVDEDDCVIGTTFMEFSPVYLSLLAKRLRKPIVVYANSTTRTGNVVVVWRLQSRWLWRIMAKHFLDNVDLITVRNEDTLDYYRSLTRKEARLHLTCDPGVLLDPVDPKTVQRIMAKEKIDKNGRLLIGATVTRRLLMHAFTEYSSEHERYERSVCEIAKVLDRLTTKYESHIIFLPHCIEYYRNNDDRVVGHDIVEKMKNKSSAKVITNEYSPQELKGLIGQFDVFVGDRIHALVSALSMNVPCCTLAYRSDRRPYSIIGKDFKQEKWIFEVDTFDADALYELLIDLISSREEISRNLPSITQLTEEKALLNGRLLRTLLHSAPVNA